MAKIEDIVDTKRKNGTMQLATAYGRSALPSMGLATLVSALHARPFQPIPMTVPAVLLFSTYLNLSNYPTEAAGITAAWSGLYLIMAARRKSTKFISQFGARGLVRGATMGIAAVNAIACGATWALGRGHVDEVLVN